MHAESAAPSPPPSFAACCLQVGMAPFLVLEAGTIPAYGFGWLDIWNGLDAATYFIQAGPAAAATVAAGGQRQCCRWYKQRLCVPPAFVQCLSAGVLLTAMLLNAMALPCLCRWR